MLVRAVSKILVVTNLICKECLTFVSNFKANIPILQYLLCFNVCMLIYCAGMSLLQEGTTWR